MPRQRFIWPSIWVSENFMDLTHRQRLLFIGMFSLADDDGKIKASSKYLKASIFPGDEINFSEIDKDVNQLHNTGSIILYDSEIGKIAIMKNWKTFQKPKYPTPSKLPDPEENQICVLRNSGRIPGEFPEHSGNVPLWDGLGWDGMGWVGMGKYPCQNSPNSDECISPKTDNIEQSEEEWQNHISKQTHDKLIYGTDEILLFAEEEDSNNSLPLQKIKVVTNRKNGKAPYTAIVDGFNSTCLDLSKVISITAERQKAMDARWKEDKERQSVEWFIELFKTVHGSDFLCGRSDAGTWQATYDWIFKKANMIKIQEGQYKNKFKKSEEEKMPGYLLTENDTRNYLMKLTGRS